MSEESVPLMRENSGPEEHLNRGIGRQTVFVDDVFDHEGFSRLSMITHQPRVGIHPIL